VQTKIPYSRPTVEPRRLATREDKTKRQIHCERATKLRTFNKCTLCDDFIVSRGLRRSANCNRNLLYFGIVFSVFGKCFLNKRDLNRIQVCQYRRHVCFAVLNAVTHRTAFSDYTGRDLFWSTVFIFLVTFLSSYFGRAVD